MGAGASRAGRLTCVDRTIIAHHQDAGEGSTAADPPKTEAPAQHPAAHSQSGGPGNSHGTIYFTGKPRATQRRRRQNTGQVQQIPRLLMA